MSLDCGTKQAEHANSTHEGPSQLVDSNSGPSLHLVTMVPETKTEKMNQNASVSRFLCSYSMLEHYRVFIRALLYFQVICHLFLYFYITSQHLLCNIQYTPESH